MADGASRPIRAALWPALVLIALLALAPALSIWLDDPFTVKIATRIVIFAIGAVALDLTLGYAGLVSLCQAAFFGVGGYVVGILAWHQANSEAVLAGWMGSSELALTLPLAFLVAGLFAAAVGAVSLRTGGPYFIMITLAFNQMLYYGAVALQKYGGDDGLQIINPLTLFGYDISNRYKFFYLALTMLLATVLLIDRLARSRFGVVLRAAAVNETRAIAVGVAPWPYRLVAFAITGALAGLAGALLAASQQFISPADMAWDRSGDFVVMTALGGVATVWGPIIGAAAFIFTELSLSSYMQHWQLPFGLIILAIVLLLRGGLAQLVDLARGAKKGGEAVHD
ncbi:MAG: branched-chain amino acid ABC transporter permease [Hyphomicrobiales bacterium]|nr:branched-chain amino acid ABC transporter permease [Hyphomicrobiales bacterium]